MTRVVAHLLVRAASTLMWTHGECESSRQATARVPARHARISAPHSSSESGFAMLLLFAMAAVIAIMLYNALPRVAFESQRDQEETLIERGEQYKRAIQVYYRKLKRYPAKMEDLDNTNGLRFLRHKYVDPMTGKSEWRLIHIGPGGQLTDSLIKKKDEKKQESVNNFITELQPIGGGPQQNGPPNASMRRRPSEGQQGGAPGDPFYNPAGGVLPGTPGQPGQYATGVPGQVPYPQYQPQQYQPQTGQAVQGQFQPLPQFGGGVAGMNTAQPGMPVNSQFGGASPTPYPAQYSTQPGAQGAVLPPFPQPGSQSINPGAAGQNAAADVIRNLLTTPRPGGFPGAQGGNFGGTQIGGGIAGVASTVERSGIKLYNEQDEYNKWEFVYDFSKDKSNGPVTGVAQPSANPAGLNGPGLGQGSGSATSSTATSGQVPRPTGMGAMTIDPATGLPQGIYPQPGLGFPGRNTPGTVSPQPLYPPQYPQPGSAPQPNPQQPNSQQPTILPSFPGVPAPPAPQP